MSQKSLTPPKGKSNDFMQGWRYRIAGQPREPGEEITNRNDWCEGWDEADRQITSSSDDVASEWVMNPNGESDPIETTESEQRPIPKKETHIAEDPEIASLRAFYAEMQHKSSEHRKLQAKLLEHTESAKILRKQIAALEEDIMELAEVNPQQTYLGDSDDDQKDDGTSRAFREGETAGYDGVTATSCEYSEAVPERREQWLEGWSQGRRRKNTETRVLTNALEFSELPEDRLKTAFKRCHMDFENALESGDADVLDVEQCAIKINDLSRGVVIDRVGSFWIIRPLMQESLALGELKTFCEQQGVSAEDLEDLAYRDQLIGEYSMMKVKIGDEEFLTAPDFHDFYVKTDA